MKRKVEARTLKIAAFAALAAAAVGLSVARKPARPERPVPPVPETAAPDFHLSDLGGQVVSLAAYRDRVVLLNFWASWCFTCKEEMPDLDRLQKRVGGKDFTVLGLSVDEGGRKPVMSFVARYNPSFPIALADRATAVAYGVYGLPVSYLIDRQGVLRKVYHGPIDEAAVENDILKLVTKS